MGAGSFGAFMDAARNMSRFSSQLAHRIELMRITAKALGHDLKPPMETFDCYHLCLRCRQLGQLRECCKQCGGREFIDLQNFGYTQSFLELEEQQRRTAPTWAKAVGWGASIVMFVAMIWGSMLFFGEVFGGVVLFFASLGIWLGLSLAFGKWLRKPLARMVNAKRTNKPLRWLREEIVEEDDRYPQLVSPLTQRACGAYGLRVYLKDDEAMHQQILLLDEQKYPQGEERLGARDTWRQLERLDVRMDSQALEEWLRTRGLSQDSGELLFYESTRPANSPESAC